MTYQGGPVTNMGEAQSFLAYYSPEATAKRKKAQAEAYANSPEGMAKAKAKQDKQNTITKIYNEQGDQALADWYLKQDPKTVTRGETNPAKLVKKMGGKYTFAQAAQEEKQDYDAAVASSPNASLIPGWSGSTFQFAVDNPYQGGNSATSTPAAPSAPAPATTPSGNTAPDVSGQPVEDTDGKFSWQKSKEKAQAWKAENDKVKEQVQAFNVNDTETQKAYTKQFDFSGKNFTNS